MTKISFNNKKNPFFKSLNKKVNQYFSDKNIQKTGNKNLFTKSIIQIVAAVGLYVTLVFFTPGTVAAILLCALMGISMAVIGFNIMHEAGHQSFSKYKWLNKAGSYSLNALGGNSYFWKIKHNLNHHTYTNIEGMDSDIDVRPFMRLHENQPHLWIHRFQHLYCFFLYGLSYLSWIFLDDFKKYFTGKIADGQQKKLALREHLIFWGSKLLYLGVYLLIPILMVGFLKAITGFLIVAFVCGITIAVVFQLAHVVEGTTFPTPDKDTNKIEQEWAIHQINTTANFSTKSRIVSWLLGGLNFQVEHHLYPRISHVHYPKINALVRETCEEFKISYLEFNSVFDAIRSHFAHVKRLRKAV